MADPTLIPDWLLTPAERLVSEAGQLEGPVTDPQAARDLYGDYARPAPSREARIRLILDLVAEGHSVAAAARAAGIAPSTVYAWRRTDEAFAAALEGAEALRADLIEGEAIRRAVHGWDEPVYHRGELVGYVRRYSDSLLDRLLRGYLPERYRDRASVEQHVTGDLPPTIVLPAEMSVDEWRARYVEGECERIDDDDADA
ncbi:MAG TPA: hypothetical protein ENK10_05440 [Acidobacteria bacterium]|nr:hypothetical protein [Acidobacteriota bacterium]